MAPVKKEQPSAPALLHGLTVLEAVSSSSTPLSFSDLLTASGAARSTLIRLLRILVEENWLAKGKGGYLPGIRLLTLTASTDPSAQLLKATGSLLDVLMEKTGNTAGLFAIEGDEIVLLDKRIHPAAIVLRETGSRDIPEGRAPWDWVVFRERPALIPDPPESEAFAQAIARAFDDLESLGWCVDDQVGMNLVCRMAAPLRHPRSGALLGVVVLGGNPLTLPAKSHADAGQHLLHTAEQICARL